MAVVTSTAFECANLKSKHTELSHAILCVQEPVARVSSHKQAMSDGRSMRTEYREVTETWIILELCNEGSLQVGLLLLLSVL